MYYSSIGILALLILIIENQDILVNAGGSFAKPAWKVYRRFLFAVLVYYITDILWGFLEAKKLPGLLFADTTVYFAAMAVGVFFWVQFTVSYLDEKSAFGQFLVYAGKIIAGLIGLLAVVNIFIPVLFTVDAACVYSALPLRYAVLASQILLLLMISGYALASMVMHPMEKEKRYLALTLFGVIMAAFLLIQIWFPYLPLYAIAYMLGTSLLHTVVVNDEKEEFKRGMKEAEKIAELKQTISSLMDNMPGINYTKDAETGVYLACNKEFAKYANKQSPEEVLGHKPADLFDPVTAGRSLNEDRIALSMDGPYIFFEDVQDAAGNQRQLQTTKLKYTDANGRLCVLGMSQDVTDLVRIRRENAMTKEAYEKTRSTGIIYTRIAQTLARGYTDLYYVNLDSEEFIEYRTDEESGSLQEVRCGYHFFEECQIETEQLVHPDDLATVQKALDRKTLVAALDRNRSFVMTYRIMQGGKPIYVTMKVSRMEDDDRFIILGVTNTDEEMKQRHAAERVREEQLAYTRLRALNNNHIWVYVVDPVTDRYRELREAKETKSPTLAKEGVEFFKTMQELSLQYTCPEDQHRFLASFTKENVLEDIARNGVYTLHYRFMRDGSPTYVILKAAAVEEKDGTRLVVGLIDVDDQTRLEENNEKRMAQAQAKATIDALTGVKNRHAYLVAEERMNEQIAENNDMEFAVIILDVNNLKKVNDTEGHAAGDQYIKDACKIICDTFKHSPVFRVGGDEFAVISRGEDYTRIDELVEKMKEQNREALQSGGVVIACGMAKREDEMTVAPVFERADQAMYENKSKLKGEIRVES